MNYKKVNFQNFITLTILLFQPFLNLIQIPIAWFFSLKESLILLNGKWSNYMGFLPNNAINCMFYRTQYINIDRYGKNNNSPIIGLGNFPISRWFHLSLFSSYIFSHAGAVTTLVCNFIWVFSNIIWISSENTNTIWILAITVVFFFSSTSYSMAFARQNYQILSWMFFPMALFFVHNADYVLATFTWFLIALFAISPIVFSFPIILFLSFKFNTILPLISLFLGSLVLILQFIPLILKGEIKAAIVNTLKLIGGIKKQVRYSRDMKNFGLANTYFFSLYSICTLLISFAIGQFQFVLFLGLIIFFVNERFLRIGDTEHVIVLISSLFCYVAFINQPSLILFLSLFLALNPIGRVMNIQEIGKGIKKFKPFDHSNLLNKTFELFENVKKRDRVFAVFDDPKNKYFKIFDGYRVLHELNLVVAAKKDFHLIPDYWAVSETNYIGSIDLFGREPKLVESRCKQFNAKYALIYQYSKTRLNKIWNDKFILISSLDIDKFSVEFDKSFPWQRGEKAIKWFLLEYKDYESDVKRI